MMMLKIKYKEYYNYFFSELFILITNKTLFKKLISKYAFKKVFQSLHALFFIDLIITYIRCI